MGIISDAGMGIFAATNVTKALAIKGSQGGIYHRCAFCSYLSFFPQLRQGLEEHNENIG
jgi:hypothetical protein